MRRFSVLVATVMATAVISATPAPAAEAMPASTQQVAAVTPAAAVAPGSVPTNWFSDWSVCIWGAGVPIGLAWEFKPSWGEINKLSRNPHTRGYVSRVVAACGRFIRS